MNQGRDFGPCAFAYSLPGAAEDVLSVDDHSRRSNPTPQRKAPPQLNADGAFFVGNLLCPSAGLKGPALFRMPRWRQPSIRLRSLIVVLAALRGSADFNPRLRLPWLRLVAEPQGTVRWSHGSLLCPFRFVGECSDPVSAASRRLPIGPESAWRSSFPTGRSLLPRAPQVKHFRPLGPNRDRMLQARRAGCVRSPDIVLSGGCVHSPFFSLAAPPPAV